MHSNINNINELIITIFKNNKYPKRSNDIIDEILINNNNDMLLKNLETCVEYLQINPPKNSYKIIYQMFKDFDKPYYDKKMAPFQQKILNFINGVCKIDSKYISNFIDSAKFDMALELSLLYNRVRKYPDESIQLYKIYGYHPYVILLNDLDKEFNDNTISIKMVCRYLEQLANKRTSQHIIIDAIRRRSELFLYTYSHFAETNKILQKNSISCINHKKEYYPFKIFSSSLFCMEHIFYFSFENSCSIILNKSIK